MPLPIKMSRRAQHAIATEWFGQEESRDLPIEDGRELDEIMRDLPGACDTHGIED
jgi:hypothetical protein